VRRAGAMRARTQPRAIVRTCGVEPRCEGRGPPPNGERDGPWRWRCGLRTSGKRTCEPYAAHPPTVDGPVKAPGLATRRCASLAPRATA
jgi:hypothetical protein